MVNSTTASRADESRRAGMNAKAAVLAGLIAGVVFVIAEMALLALTGGNVWGPPRMMGAIVLGESVLPPPATFDFGVVMAGMLVHFGLSIVLGLIFAAVFHRLGAAMTLLAGALFGLAVYVVNFYVMTAVFPWFANARTWVTIVSHIVFGLALAASYRPLASRSS